MTGMHFNETLFHGRMRQSAGWLFWLGLGLAVLGVAAIIFPLVSTMIATVLAGWVLALAGVATFVGSFSIRGTGPFFGAVLLSLLSAAAGVFLLCHPVAGAVALTLLLGAIFLVQGAFELFFAYELHPLAGAGGMVISALASVAVGLIVLVEWPGISFIALGVLLGVNFISTGLGYMLVSRALK